MTHNFTAVGAGPHVLANHGDDLRFEVSGTFSGTVFLEKSVDGGLSWQRVVTTAAALDSSILVEAADQGSVWFRFRCTVFTSGTIETELTVVEPSSGGGGGEGVWGSITGDIADQSDLQDELDLKAPLASPTFTGTITTPLTASRALATGASGVLAVSATTATELGYVNGVTSAIQTQLNAKAPTASPTFSGTITTPLTASRVVTTGASNELAASSITTTTLGYLDATSSIQTQLDAKAPSAAPTLTGNVTISAGTADTVPYLNGSKVVTSSAVTPTELGYLSGVTSAIQTQFAAKAAGAASSTDNAIARFDGTDGKAIQNSVVTISDAGVVVIPADSTASENHIQFGSNTGLYVGTYPGSTTRFRITAPDRVYFRMNSLETVVFYSTEAWFGDFTNSIEYPVHIIMGKSGATGNPLLLGYSTSTAVGTSGTGEDDLCSLTIGANALSSNGRRVRGKAWGTFAANANTKTLKLKIGGSTVLTVGPGVYNAGSWVIDFEMIRTGASAEKYVVEFKSSNATAGSTVSSGTLALSTTAGIVVKCTGETLEDSVGSTTNDVLNEALSIYHTTGN